MDQKHLANLDPRLKEVYDRVMGTNVNLTKPQQQSIPPTPMQQQQPSPSVASTPLPQPMVPPTAKPAMTTQEMHATYQPQVFTAEHHKPDHKKEEKHASPTGEKKKSGAVPLLLGVFGFVFFVVYTIFWMKLFNLSIPFLPF